MKDLYSLVVKENMEKMKRSVAVDGGSMSTLTIVQPALKVHALTGLKKVEQLSQPATILKLRDFSTNQMKDLGKVKGKIKVLMLLSTKNGLRGLL